MFLKYSVLYIIRSRFSSPPCGPSRSGALAPLQTPRSLDLLDQKKCAMSEVPLQLSVTPSRSFFSHRHSSPSQLPLRHHSSSLSCPSLRVATKLWYFSLHIFVEREVQKKKKLFKKSSTLNTSTLIKNTQRKKLCHTSSCVFSLAFILCRFNEPTGTNGIGTDMVPP